ncbi:hypothetical protein GCM10023185_23320 [Hymenobacter saemangeumensis]|uniref:Outer membrane protein beta-barrel domain-containing protein n=1 Tax=Hymenobacter saemangeumensis TaxID=1084522 RepID=A0ABP8IGP2_9BACT
MVRLPNKATLTLVVRDAAQLRQLSTYHLDSLTTRLAGYIKQAESAAQAGTSEKVTMEFYPDKDQPGQNLPEQIRITANKKQKSNRVDVALNKALGVNVTHHDSGSKSYNIDIDTNDKKPKTPADTTRKKNKGEKHRVELRFDFGLNTLVNRETNATGGVPSLSTWGSNYVNVGLDYVFPLFTHKHTRMAFTLGPQLSFNDLELRGNEVWVERNGRTLAERAPNDVQVDKARMLVTTLNMPLMLHLRLRNARGKNTLSVGAGGFAGYRLSSSSLVEYTLAGSDDEREDKVSGRFHLNDWQYGLQGQIGFHWLTFFAKYNLNSLFNENRGPQAQVLSFGLNFIGY